MHAGGGGDWLSNLSEGVRRLEDLDEKIQKSDRGKLFNGQHVEIEETGKPRAKSSIGAEFKIAIAMFFADVLDIVNILSTSLFSRSVVAERSDWKNLTKRNPSLSESLSDIMKSVLSEENEDTHLSSFSSVELKRISDNLGALIRGGIEEKLKEEGEKQECSLFNKELFLNSSDKIKVFKAAVDITLKNRYTGYVIEKVLPDVDEAGTFVDEATLNDALERAGVGTEVMKVEKFSEDFSTALFRELTGSKEADLREKAIVDGKELPLCSQAKKDLLDPVRARSFILVDQNNVRCSLFEYAKKGKSADYKPTSDDLLKALREFCGYNFFQAPNSLPNRRVDEHLFKISQYFCQNLGNTYVIATSIQSHPQLPDGTPYMPVAQNQKQYSTTLTACNWGFKIEATGEYSGISYVSSTAGRNVFETDPKKSNLEYHLGINLVRYASGQLVEEENTEGYLRGGIVLLEAEAVDATTTSVNPSDKGIRGFRKEAKFSEEFSEALYKNLMEEVIDKREITPWVMDPDTGSTATKDLGTGSFPERAKTMNINATLGKDLDRIPFKVFYRNGETRDFQLSDYPDFTIDDEEKLRKVMDDEGEDAIKEAIEAEKKRIGQKRAEVSEERIAAFLKICGYDPATIYESEEARVESKKTAEEHLFKLAQFMSQTLGSGFEMVHMVGENSPQVLENGDRFNVNPVGATREFYVTVKEGSDGKITLEMVNKFTDIKTIQRFRLENDFPMPLGDPEPIAPGGSYTQKSGIVYNPATKEWEEDEEGTLEFDITVLPGTAS